MAKSPPHIVCARCRRTRAAADAVNEICGACVQNRLERAVAEQRAEFFDTALNTLTIRMRELAGLYYVEVEHAERRKKPRVGMTSIFGGRQGAIDRLIELVRETMKDPGWKAVEPRWDVQLVDVRQTALLNPEA